MVKIEIISKNIVHKLIDKELLRVENRFSKELERLRKRILELENETQINKKPLKLVVKNKK